MRTYSVKRTVRLRIESAVHGAAFRRQRSVAGPPHPNRPLMEIIDERLTRLRLHGGAGSQLKRLAVELLPASTAGRLAFVLVTAIALKLLVWDQLRLKYSAARVRL